MTYAQSMRKYLLILSAAGVLVSCGGNGRRQASATEVGAGEGAFNKDTKTTTLDVSDDVAVGALKVEYSYRPSVKTEEDEAEMLTTCAPMYLAASSKLQRVRVLFS